MRKFAVLAWLLFLSVAALAIALEGRRGLPVETSLNALIPEISGDPVMRAASAMVRESGGKRLVLMARGGARGENCRALDAVAEALENQGLARAAASGFDQAMATEILRDPAILRAALLSTDDREDLRAGRVDAVLNRALARLVSPLAPIDGAMLESDPFLFVSAYFAERAALFAPATVSDRFCVRQMTVAGDPYASDVNSKIKAIVEREKLRTTTETGLSVFAAGPVLYAAAGNAVAAREATIFGTLSMAVVLVLVLSVFRGPAPIVYSIMVIGSGVMVGLAATLSVHGKVHSFTLIFGVSLVGTAVDYALHYCCTRFDATQLEPMKRLREVLPGLSLGLSTSLIGFAAMQFVPVPALREISLFSGAGLVAAFLTAVLILPTIDRSSTSRQGGALVSYFGELGAFWHGARARAARLSVLVLLGMSALFGGLRFHPEDDVRRFQSLPEELRREEAEIRTASDRIALPRILIVEGETTEAALRREEALIDRIGATGVTASALIFPSVERQRQDADLIRSTLSGAPLERVREVAGTLAGVNPVGSERSLVTVESLGTLGGTTAALRGATEDGRVVHLVLIDRPGNFGSISGDGVRDLDLAEILSRAFADQREAVTLVLAATFVALFVIALCRYGFWAAGRAILPPLVAVGLAPLLLAGFWGATFTFFDAMALVLVATLGIDYALFWIEAPDARKSVTLLAVGLSAITTIAAFGVLAFSSVEAVRAFGSTVSLGVALAFVFAPLAARPADGKSHV